MSISITIAIGAMSEDDLGAVLAIDAVSLREPGSGGDPAEHRATRERHFREELARAWGRLRVARDVDGTVLGYVLFWHVTDEIHILDVAVAPAARRRGVGTALVSEVTGYATAHAAAKVLLEVRASNAPAIALYERLGFDSFNVRKSYYPDGEDGIEMMLLR